MVVTELFGEDIADVGVSTITVYGSPLPDGVRVTVVGVVPG